LWIRDLEKPVARACGASGYFFTFLFDFNEKKFWKINFQFLKKLTGFIPDLKSKTGKDLCRSASWNY
jgi:hypothetical protein